MALTDWVVANEASKVGGQGSVRKVQRISDGQSGALKRPHPEAIVRRERRYRFLTEVASLRALQGNGVPQVLEANEAGWLEDGTDLFLVMEWVEGPTLQEAVQARPPTVSQALACTRRVLDTVSAGHRVSLLHRDLKPDNVILSAGQWERPVLVDFGIAWYGGNGGAEFLTPDGIELGNRFLRLPELAPGGEHYDPRSDIAMVAGLLFFMLAGKAPRLPVDHGGRHPHEGAPSPIRSDVLKDRRWPSIGRLLRIAFQQRLEARFRDADEFSKMLAQVDVEEAVNTDDLDEHIARFRELTTTSAAREMTEAAPAMESASQSLLTELTRIWHDLGLQWGGQNPVFKGGGTSNEFYCVVSRVGQTDPTVVFRHSIEFSEGRLTASWSVEDGPTTIEFEGSSADHEGLRDTLMEAARRLAGEVIRRLNEKLEPKATLRPFL